jgi:hypothetical protein
MLFESCNCAFGGVDSVIVGWDEVDFHMVVSDVCFYGLGTFIVHYIECACIPMGIEVSKRKAWRRQLWHSGCKRTPKTHIACCRRIARGRHWCHWFFSFWCVSMPMPQSKTCCGWSIILWWAGSDQPWSMLGGLLVVVSTTFGHLCGVVACGPYQCLWVAVGVDDKVGSEAWDSY